VYDHGRGTEYEEQTAAHLNPLTVHLGISVLGTLPRGVQKRAGS
jgi:hypothetical protein